MRILTTTLLSILFITLVFTGCKSTETSIGQENEIATIVISYEQKASSAPHAPEYKMDVYSNKQMFLNALKNLDKSGKYMRTLSTEEYNQLIKAFSEASFFSYKDEYISDASNSLRSLTFNQNNKSKTITVDKSAPENLKELELNVQSYLDRVGWSKMSW